MNDGLNYHGVWEQVNDTVSGIISDYQNNSDADRDEVIDRLYEECDTLWGQLVKPGQIDQYTVNDMLSTVSQCAAIIKAGEEYAWVEDDSGLWEGLLYGVLASVAYFTLRNLLYQSLAKKGFDTNNDRPFASLG